MGLRLRPLFRLRLHAFDRAHLLVLIRHVRGGPDGMRDRRNVALVLHRLLECLTRRTVLLRMVLISARWKAYELLLSLSFAIIEIEIEKLQVVGNLLLWRHDFLIHLFLVPIVWMEGILLN